VSVTSAAKEGVAFSERAEVRDVLAWMRLLSDPKDAAAVSRALVRPPIELRQVDLVRVIQVARRRSLDMVSALGAAIESPQIPPQARERIQRFLRLHKAAALALEAGRPDLFARVVLGAERQDRAQETDGPTQRLQATLRALREEVLGDVTRIAGRLSEMRLDTDLDVSHGTARYLELVKLTALLERPVGQSLAEALPDINARLLAAATSMQREILQTSPLDAALLAAEREERDEQDGREEKQDGREEKQDGGEEKQDGGEEEQDGPEEKQDGGGQSAEPVAQGVRNYVRAFAASEEPSLQPFLPRMGQGLVLSASDIETYRSCPLRYKYARVLRIPSEQTLNQRFGIMVHQVLERYHASQASTLEEMMKLLATAWRRGGFGESETERELHEKARVALTRYHERLGEDDAEPVWFERSFSFTLGSHRVRGRVDRIDRLGDGEYELIDYKTGRPKSAEQLGEDIQLSLYALGAREDWQLEAPRQAYYYVLDDEKVPVPPRGERDAEWIAETVLEVGEGIMAQSFEPTPSESVCAMCDYRILCPVAER
jgi:DNA helicase-2/ATP-dependent DNA helicase PcrA